MVNSKLLVGMAIALVVIVAAAYVVLSVQKAPAASGGLVALQLTDPPVVPTGTQSLMIKYSSLEVHTSGAAHSGWIESNNSGNVNLLALLNLSQTIGTVTVPNNSTIDMVRFNVTSANITINGTVYNVTLPSRQVTANIEGETAVNSSGGVLLSLSPTIVTILTSNTTVFVMVPSVKAIMIANGTNQTTVVVGERHSLTEHDGRELSRITPNIAITGASLESLKNATSLSVTVMNNANQSVLVKNIGLSGDIATSLNVNAIDYNTAHVEAELGDRIRNGTACLNISASNTVVNITTQDRPNATAGISYNITMGQNRSDNSHQGYGEGAGANGSATVSGSENEASGYMLNLSELGNIGERIKVDTGMKFNGSICTASGFMQFQNEFRNRSVGLAENFGAQQMRFRQVHFLVAANGTLMLPYSIEDFNDTGYPLQAGQSHTFTFNGEIVTSDGGIVITPVINSAYTVEIGAESDAKASYNVTAMAG